MKRNIARKTFSNDTTSFRSCQSVRSGIYWCAINLLPLSLSSGSLIVADFQWILRTESAFQLKAKQKDGTVTTVRFKSSLVSIMNTQNGDSWWDHDSGRGSWTDTVYLDNCWWRFSPALLFFRPGKSSRCYQYCQTHCSVLLPSQRANRLTAL